MAMWWWMRSLQAATRAGWLNLADGQATAVLFDVPAAECVRRNSERGSSAVPDAQMERLCALTLARSLRCSVSLGRTLLSVAGSRSYLGSGDG